MCDEFDCNCDCKCGSCDSCCGLSEGGTKILKHALVVAASIGTVAYFSLRYGLPGDDVQHKRIIASAVSAVSTVTSGLVSSLIENSFLCSQEFQGEEERKKEDTPLKGPYSSI